jgi:hypothetical protein
MTCAGDVLEALGVDPVATAEPAPLGAAAQALQPARLSSAPNGRV